MIDDEVESILYRDEDGYLREYLRTLDNYIMWFPAGPSIKVLEGLDLFLYELNRDHDDLPEIRWLIKRNIKNSVQVIEKMNRRCEELSLEIRI